MPKFKVTILRTSYSFTDIEVEADTEEKAHELALEESGDHEYREGSAEYEVYLTSQVDAVYPF